MTYETIEWAVNQGVAQITLNRPKKLNAFNKQMIAECEDAFKIAARDAAVRCLVITGNGRAFSAGQDLKEVSSRDDGFSLLEHLRGGYNQLVRRLTSMEIPVIASVNGVAAGAGCGIALAADMRIASDQASFMLAFSKVGLVPDSGLSWTLPRLIGYARAYEMALTADQIPADQALDWGMVNYVVPHQQLPEITRAWALQLASGPTLAYGLAKRAMLKAADSSLEEALEQEAYLQEIAGRSKDRAEGVAAFLEKREPVFTGQ